MLRLRRNSRYTFLLRLTSCWPVPLSTVFPPSLFFPQTPREDRVDTLNAAKDNNIDENSADFGDYNDGEDSGDK